MRSIWFIGGAASVALGAIGIFLPLLPTVPFFLLAAFFFARSSEFAHNWLINHNTFGPPIKDWNETGAISIQMKRVATITIIAGFLFALFLDLRPWFLLLHFIILSGVTTFIWTRPNE
ncbi:MAG: YbaN family protein [Rhodobacteraceae bacterium]|nr:YbaN family protein [Paracoccaceae bacterium]